MATDWLLEQSNISHDLSAEGVTFVFIRPGKGAYDPVQGEYEQTEAQTFEAHGIEKMIKASKSSSGEMWFKGLPVEEGDLMLLLDCSTYKAELEDLVTINGEDWAVKGQTALRPGSIDLIRYVVIRRV